MFRLAKRGSFWGVGVVSAAVLLAGCGGSSGGGTKLATIDQDWAERALIWVEDVAPGCVTEAPAVPIELVMKSITQAEELVTLVSTKTIPADAADSKSAAAPRAIIAGPCGGSVTVTSDHADGSTDYQMAFSQYCMAVPAPVAMLSAERSIDGAATKVVADDELLIDGIVNARQVGKPSDFGPLVSELNSSFKDLALTVGADRTVVSVDSAKTVYGTPFLSWLQPAPTEADPDKFSVSKVTMDFETRGTVDVVRSLSGTRWGPTDAAIVDINAGSYVRGETGEAFNIATPSTIVVNIEQAEWVSGEVDLLGADNTGMTVAPGDSTGTYTVVLNGDATGSADCADGQEPLEHIVDLVVDQLPIY